MSEPEKKNKKNIKMKIKDKKKKKSPKKSREKKLENKKIYKHHESSDSDSDEDSEWLPEDTNCEHSDSDEYSEESEYENENLEGANIHKIISSIFPKKSPKEKKKPVRIKVFGHPVTHVLKWMGANGWADRFDDAALAICTVADNYKISDWTIKLQLRAGKKIADPNDWDTLNKRNQKLIELDKEQIQELEDAIL